MKRDDEIYALAEKDTRVFFPGSHKTRVNALRPLLRDGWTAEWEERGDAVRKRMGWVWLVDPAGEKHEARGDGFVKLLGVSDVAEAWRMLKEDPAIDPAFLRGLCLVGNGGSGKVVAATTPRSMTSAIALATAPAEMRAAERLVQEAYARGAPFGVGPCPPIKWRSAMGRDLQEQTFPRTGLTAVHQAIIDALGYGVWLSPAHAAEKMFSSTRYGVSITEKLRPAATDMGGAMQFDAARTKKVAAPNGTTYADHENPFEPLLRIAYSGIIVDTITAEHVVLAVDEERRF